MSYLDELQSKIGDVLNNRFIEVDKSIVESCTRIMIDYQLNAEELCFSLVISSANSKISVLVKGLTGLHIADISLSSTSLLVDYCTTLYSTLTKFNSFLYASGINEDYVKLFIDFQTKYRKIKVLSETELSYYGLRGDSLSFSVDTKFSPVNTLAVGYDFGYYTRYSLNKLLARLDFIMENLDEITEFVRLLQNKKLNVYYTSVLEKVTYNDTVYFCVNRHRNSSLSELGYIANSEIYDSKNMELVTDTHLKNVLLSKLELFNTL